MQERLVCILQLSVHLSVGAQSFVRAPISHKHIETAHRGRGPGGHLGSTGKQILGLGSGDLLLILKQFMSCFGVSTWMLGRGALQQNGSLQRDDHHFSHVSGFDAVADWCVRLLHSALACASNCTALCVYECHCSVLLPRRQL